MIKENKGCFQKGNIPWNKGLGTEQVKCKTCDKKFLVPRYRRLVDNRGKFCSWKCRWNHKYKLAKEIKITPDIAELIGIIIGDGCVNKANKKFSSYRIFISGNPIEDKPYMDYYLPKLIKKCLNKNVKPFLASNGAYLIQFSDEPFRIFLFSLGIKPNKTRIVRIPDKIKKNQLHLRMCIPELLPNLLQKI